MDEDELPRARLIGGKGRRLVPCALAQRKSQQIRAGGEVLSSSSSSSALNACSTASSKWPLGRSMEGYADLLRGEHWELKKLQDLESNDIPEDDIRGAVHGATSGLLRLWLEDLEDNLREADRGLRVWGITDESKGGDCVGLGVISEER